MSIFATAPARHGSVTDSSTSFDESGLLNRLVHKIENIWDNSSH
jgi:hypothetical protein